MKDSASRFLVVFDFDDTIINGNSDTWIYRALPNGVLPEGIRQSYVKGRWTEFMNAVFQHFEEEGIDERNIRKHISEMPLVSGMSELIRHLGQHPEIFELVIISDSNSCFIDWGLQAHGLRSHFRGIFTNAATWTTTSRGRQLLRIEPYHHLHGHGCERCPINLCKRKVLQDFLEDERQNGMQYQGVLYLGDGLNDLCPSEISTAVFPRRGFSLERAIEAQALNAEVLVWESGLEVLAWIKERIKTGN